MSYIVPRSIPKKCIHCDFSKLIASRDDEIECTLERIYVRPYEKYAFCPLVEIHTPHGRLIDADKLNTYDLSPVNGFCVIGVTEEDIGLTETILGAEGSEK